MNSRHNFPALFIIFCLMTTGKINSMEWVKSKVSNFIAHWNTRKELQAFRQLEELSKKESVDLDAAYDLSQVATRQFQKEAEKTDTFSWKYPNFETFITNAETTTDTWNSYVRKWRMNSKEFKDMAKLNYAAPIGKIDHKKILKSLNKDNIENIMKAFEEDYKKRLPYNAHEFRGPHAGVHSYPAGFDFIYERNKEIPLDNSHFMINTMYKKRLFFEEKHTHLKNLGELLEKMAEKKQELQ